LVLTAANPTFVRDEKNGSISEFKPAYFMLGEGLSINIYEIVDFRRPDEYKDILSSVNEQDYAHSTLRARVTLMKQA
jgi:hypothetical protein